MSTADWGFWPWLVGVWAGVKPASGAPFLRGKHRVALKHSPGLATETALRGTRAVLGGPVAGSRPKRASAVGQSFSIHLQGVRLDCELVRTPRRSIGLRIDYRGLQVRAPAGISRVRLEELLQSKSRWILRKLKEQSLRNRTVSTGATCLDAMDSVFFLGQCLQVIGEAGLSADQHRLHVAQGCTTPVLALGQIEDLAKKRTQIIDWLRRQAHSHFVQRLDHFAEQMDVAWTKLALSNARTRWGSANACGLIRLNWRLVQLAPELVDYVVVHELAHLREMNHGPKFWALVESVLPDHRVRRQRLRCWALSKLPSSEGLFLGPAP